MFYKIVLHTQKNGRVEKSMRWVGVKMVVYNFYTRW